MVFQVKCFYADEAIILCEQPNYIDLDANLLFDKKEKIMWLGLNQNFQIKKGRCCL